MHFEYIIIGCGVSGIMAASMISELTDNFIILEMNNDLGGIWSYIAKDETTLQVNSSLYLLDSFFHIPGEKIRETYACKNTIVDRLHKFVKYKKLDRKIQFQSKVVIFYNKCDDVIITYEQNNILKTISCHYLFVCTGSLSVAKTTEYDYSNVINYSKIINYDKYFENKNKIIVIGSGASGVEVCNNAIRCGVKDITLVYRNNVGFYFNNFFLEHLFMIMYLLPKNIANSFYQKIHKFIAWFYNIQLPPFIGDHNKIYPFSTNIINAYNEGKFKLIKNDKLNDQMIQNSDGVIETVGFENSLQQFNIDNKKLYNLNTRHENFKNVFFIGLNKSNTGTITYSNFFMLSGIFNIINKKLCEKRSNIEDSLYTPLLYLKYFFDIGIGIGPIIEFIKLWIYGFFVRLIK